MPRNVLVTGANRGIGLAVAQSLAADGDQVTITHRSGNPPAGLAGVHCDVTDPEAIAAAFDQVEREHGPVQVLVANAGITRDQLLLRMSDQDWQEVLATNLTGVFQCVRRATKSMMRQRFGRIVLVSSVVAMMGSAGQVNYAASKAALIGMARSMARELGGRGITTNVVAPGFIQTDMTAALSPERIESISSAIPNGALGSVGDVAHAVRFLASDAAGYINGAVLPVDGGLGMGH